MAFEDRSSPNTATSPCASDCGGNFNTPNSPESTRTSPYTCMTISNSQECRPYSPVLETPSTKNKGNPKMEHIERSFFRITSFALPSSKTECDRDSPVSYRSSSPIGGVASSVSPPPSNDPVIQTLKYSIRNILQPDFGKSAVLKTKDLSEISFRPYENTSSDNQQKALFRIAPLGSLCQTVSQIGSTNSTTNLTLHLSSNINTNSVLSRKSQSPKLKNPNLLSPEEVKKDDNNVPKLWPAWVYCTRYSDRPSSGKTLFWRGLLRLFTSSIMLNLYLLLWVSIYGFLILFEFVVCAEKKIGKESPYWCKEYYTGLCPVPCFGIYHAKEMPHNTVD